MATLLQILALKLGVVTNENLASQCKKSFHPAASILLWISAEVAIMATDLAEVIGSAVALNLIFGLPIWIGVLVTILDVLVIIIGLQKHLSVLEVLLSLMLLIVFGCLIAILITSNADFLQIVIGLIPHDPVVLFDSRGLYLTIGLIGATVMPHSLYLGSHLGQEHFSEISSKLLSQNQSDFSDSTSSSSSLSSSSVAPSTRCFADASSILSFNSSHSNSLNHALDIPSMGDPSLYTCADPPRATDGEDDDDDNIHSIGEEESVGDFELSSSDASPSHALDHPLEVQDFPPHMQATIADFLKQSIIALTISLTVACCVNATILAVAAANLYGNPDYVDGLSGAFVILDDVLGRAWALTFAFSLLLSGQAATLTSTIAGAVVMDGFLNLRMRPWMRRLLTRSLVILPSTFIAFISGEEGLNQLLVFSQVVLSLQLPFSIAPLVYFTSDKKLMGTFANGRLVQWSAYAIAATLVVFNFIMIFL